MLYNKPKIKYTEMCQYVDNNIYRADLNDEEEQLIFEYLYHISSMLAYKAKLFSNTSYYEDFAIYLATSIFMRLKNPNQFEYKPDGTPKLKQVKSVLNYAKKVLYPKKVDFEQSHYCQSIEYLEDNTLFDSEYSFADRLVDSIDDKSIVEFNMCLSDIIKTAKSFILTIPYRTDTVTWNNIYLSCLLTFLNSVTLPNKDIERLQQFKRNVSKRPRFVEDLYRKASKDSVILYHLDDNMHDYIQVLTNEMKHVIAKDLSLTIHTYVPTESGLRTLVISELNMLGGEDES